jgi:hypothetical protein
MVDDVYTRFRDFVGSRQAPQQFAEGGRVGRAIDILARAFREGLSPRTRQNPRGLPMDEESRRARAESMGFDLDRPMYHGTSADADFRAFKQKDRGVWSAREPEVASEYALSNDSQGVDRNTASRVIPLVSRAENVRTPSDVDMETMRMSPNYARAQAEVFRRMRAQGADAVNMGGGVQVDLDTRNLRSPHATFDPERIREADILAGLGALGLGVTGGLEELDDRYAEGGMVMSDEEYDRRLLSRMKRDTGRVTEPTPAEQREAFASAGRDAAQLAADVLLPQSPLDAALMVALGPGGRAARLAGSTALAALEPSEAEASRLRRLIRAYHGSPYQFDKFDINKIGTGEGAQAYGRGLYFAENEAVARGYRDRLAPNQNDIRVGQYDYDPVTLRAYIQNPSDLNRDLQLERNYLAETIERFSSPLYTPEQRQRYINSAKERVQRLEALENMPPSALPDIPEGHMYEVDLYATPENFLAWDLPLREQSPEVREFFRQRGADEDFVSRSGQSQSSGDVYFETAKRNPSGRSSLYYAHPEDLRELSADMAAAGIPGTRYLDAGSRTPGDNPTYNYAVFDPEIIDIRRRYAQGGLAQLDDME